MAEKTLYKYLDVNGGLAMLDHHNLQFTNATKFNDPNIKLLSCCSYGFVMQ